jgi:LPXTG-motif cell wall-anchored protein
MEMMNTMLPATGDTFNFVPFIVIGGIALVGLVVAIVMAKKNKK